MDSLPDQTPPIQPEPQKPESRIENAVTGALAQPFTRRGLLKGIAGGTLTALIPAGIAAQSPLEDPGNFAKKAPLSQPEIAQVERVGRRFETISEMNTYIALKERYLGWSDLRQEDERFGEKFKEERSKLRPTNKERTAGFIVSDKLIEDLEKAGENPIAIIASHIDYLNKLYKEAGVNLHYSLRDIAILPDHLIGKHTDLNQNANQQHDKGIILKGGMVFYPRYQDSTWVLTQECNDTEFPNYAKKLLNRFPDKIDKGLIHELIHQVGIGDFYRSQREFGPHNTPPITRFLPDHSGFMGGGNMEKISPWEAFYLQKFIENGTFSPQHDGYNFTRILNLQTHELDFYLNILASRYEFTIQDRKNNNLTPSIDSFFLSTDREDREKNHFLVGDNFERTGDQVIVTNLRDRIEQSEREKKGTPNLFVLKSNSTPGIWLPLDRHLLTLYRLAQTGETCQPFIFINPQMPEIKESCAVGLDVITRTEKIPTEFMGNPVYGYSEINENLRAVWWVKPTPSNS